MKCALLLGIQRVRHRLCLRVQLTRRQLHKQIISTGYGAMPELLWEERDGERDRVRGRGGRREREREVYYAKEAGLASVGRKSSRRHDQISF